MDSSQPKHSDETQTLREHGIAAVIEHFEGNRERLKRFVLHRADERLSGRFDVDDVLQETFIVVQKRYQDYLDSPTVPFYVWIRSLAGQVLIDIHRKHLGARKRSVNREISLHQKLPFQSTATSIGSFLAMSDTSPSSVAIRAEQLERVQNNMDAMSEIDREVLVMRHMEQMTNEEVAAALGIDKSAATKRYLRALKRIRERVTNNE